MNTQARSGRRADPGRWAALTIFALLLGVNTRALVGDVVDGAFAPTEAAIGVLTIAFYGLIIHAYFRRTPADRTDRSVRAWAAALGATALPFLVPVASSPRESGPLAVVSTVVMTVGLVAMLWALRHLGTNLSVVPQAREVATDGPYRLTRHPLYTAEIVNGFGMALAFTGAVPWVVLVASVVLQVVRARREESLLVQALPAYAAYRARTPMLVPGLARQSRA